jgi:hypothetical protein
MKQIDPKLTAIFATGFLPPEIQAEMHSREASLGNRTNLLRL